MKSIGEDGFARNLLSLPGVSPLTLEERPESEQPVPPDVLALIDRCQSGDRSASWELVERFQDLVFGLCFRMLGNRQDAEDVAQESFLRMFRSLHRWDRTREFRPWLLAIAGNRCRTWLSNRKRKGVQAEGIEQLADHRHALAAEGSLVEEVNLALSALRDEYRKAFLLFHQHQLSYQEIAESLDCPLGTVKTWVHRARREMAETLRQRGVAEEIRSDV